AHLRYIRRSISDQSCDSVPPAPGRIVTMALLASYSPQSMRRTCRSAALSSTSPTWRSNSPAASSSPSPAISRYTPRSATATDRLSYCLIASSTCERSRSTLPACSGSFQRFGSWLFLSKSARRARRLDRSKMPPEKLDALLEGGQTLACFCEIHRGTISFLG